MTDETKSSNYENNNDDRLFIAEQKVIESLAHKSSCVIVGRCADYILRDKKNVLKVFLYSDLDSMKKRAIKYYGLDEKKAIKEIDKTNKERAKHYKFYTNRNWKDFTNYDVAFHVDKYGVEATAEHIIEMIQKG